MEYINQMEYFHHVQEEGHCHRLPVVLQEDTHQPEGIQEHCL